ncbi:MAG: hypothetical protein AAFQ41_08550 [Cyanobacteria bacterium J06623_7]
MSQELTPKQRLTQMEKLLESAIKLSHSNTAKIEANSEAIKANSEAIKAQDSKIDRLTMRMAEGTELFLDSMKVITDMQSEVRGFQVGNRRILDRLLGEDTLE